MYNGYAVLVKCLCSVCEVLLRFNVLRIFVLYVKMQCF